MKRRFNMRNSLLLLFFVIAFCITAGWWYTHYIRTDKYDPVANATEL
jgi:hypothetical protein